jgi:hypothetical protein
MSERAPALTPTELSVRLQPLGLSARDLRALLHDPDFQEISDRNSQLIFISYFIPEQCFITMNDKKLSDIYQISPGNVRKIRFKTRNHDENSPVHFGRPTSLNADQENEIVQLILSRASEERFLRKGELLNEIERIYGNIFTYG